MADLGQAFLDITEIAAGTYGRWTLTYITGEYGLDDGGEVSVARRDVSDADIPQFEDPTLPGYVCVSTDGAAPVRISYQADKHVRPWKSCLAVKVYDGCMKPGDRIRIHYGDPEGRGPGYRAQTFCEEEHLFRVLVDCAGSGDRYFLPSSPVIRIHGGYADSIEGVAPSLVKQDEPFVLLVRALDSWGNIAERYTGDVLVYPETGTAADVQEGQESMKVHVARGIGRLPCAGQAEPGICRFRLKDPIRGLSGRTNPIRRLEKTPAPKLFWGDMHGQTRETVGTGTPSLYFSFARDKAGLDFSSWQGNDFQVTDETWRLVTETVREFHDPGRFVTFLGYEWSGNTSVGGDHNIYFREDEAAIRRSSHWQIGLDRADGSDCPTLAALWREFAGRDDVMAVPHGGGRYGNLDFHDPRFIWNVEIHSHHGTYEWLVEDALARGLEIGIVAASDDHTCRPGLSWPTRKTSRSLTSFDVRGGYTGVYAAALTRKELWQALKQRHCYGTTGERILLSVRCGDRMMGDAFTLTVPPVLAVDIAGTAPLMDVELRRDASVIWRYADALPAVPGKVLITWEGMRVKGRNKRVCWDGMCLVENGSLREARPIAFDQPDEGILRSSSQAVRWHSHTSGDIDGVELELSDYSEATRLVFSSEPVSFTCLLAELRDGQKVWEAGGLNRRVTVSPGRPPIPRDLSLHAADEDMSGGRHAYWVKVIQRDGHMAWSSPMYITKKPPI